MLRSKHFVNLVNEAVNDGFDQGIKVFMENLEEHLSKTELMESAGGVENYFNNVLKKGIENDPHPVDLNEGVDEVSDEDLDELVQKYGLDS